MKFLLCLPLLFSLACATRHEIASDYNDILSQKTPPAGPRRTVVFFLIDGLPLFNVQEMLQAGKLKNIRRFFLTKNNNIYVARSVFPTLTYPNIASLLTGQPVNQHGVLGNRLHQQGHVIDFESPKARASLGHITQGQSVFARLERAGESTVSIAHTFGPDATVSISHDAKSGLSILSQDYKYVDFKSIDSLHNLLTEIPEKKWPAFIFVHLIGVDLTSHDHGPTSSQAREYLSDIDGQLNKVFLLLEAAEKKGADIMGFLSTDHGFDRKTEKFVNVDAKLKNPRNEYLAFNEGRTISIWNAADKNRQVQEWLGIPGVGFVTFKNTVGFSWRSSLGKVPPDYLTARLAQYFQTPTAPDILVIADDGVAFSDSYRGHHGGPSREEMFIPVLMRNAKLSGTGRVPDIEELLNFIR